MDNEHTGLIAAAIEDLTKGMDLLPAGQKGFAQSILKAAEKHLATGAYFSSKQKFWLFKMANKVNGADEKLAAKKAEDYVEVSPNLMETMTSAQAMAKKQVKITFEGTSKTPKIQFKMMTKGKNKGKIVVTDGLKFGQDQFYGKIDGGRFYPSSLASKHVIHFVKQCCESLQEVAQTYGLTTCMCCFCHKTLTTVESKAAGYGPVCAQHYGLPWGNVTAEQAQLKVKKYEAVVKVGPPNPAMVSGTVTGHLSGTSPNYAEIEKVLLEKTKQALASGEAVFFKQQTNPAQIYGNVGNDVPLSNPVVAESLFQESGFNCPSCLDDGMILEDDGTMNPCDVCKPAETA
jgi:hypothetical protein